MLPENGLQESLNGKVTRGGQGDRHAKVWVVRSGRGLEWADQSGAARQNGRADSVLANDTAGSEVRRPGQVIGVELLGYGSTTAGPWL